MSTTKRRLTKAEIQQAIDLYQSGELMRGVAKTLGVTQACIWSLLKRNGVRSRLAKAKRRLNEAQIQQAIDLYQAGQSMRKVAMALGVSQPTILRLLKREGIESRTRGLTNGTGRKKELAQQIIEHIKKYGGKVAHVVKEFNADIVCQTVFAYAKKAGIDLKQYRYIGMRFGHWLVEEPGWEHQFNADYKVPATCTLCGTKHKVSLVNMKSGMSSCCESCRPSTRVESLVVSEDGSKVYKSIRAFATAIATASQYQEIRRKIRLKGELTVDAVRYLLSPRSQVQ